MDVVWEKAGSGQVPLLQSLALGLGREQQEELDSGIFGVFVGAGVSWMGSILLFISCPNTTGSPACPWGSSGTKFLVFSPISTGWKLQTQLGKKRLESCGVLGIRMGTPW